MAARALTRALDLYSDLGDPRGTAETLANLGDLALAHPAAGDPGTYFARARSLEGANAETPSHPDRF